MKHLNLLFFIVFMAVLIGCKNEKEMGLDEYYPYRSVTRLEIQKVAKTDFFIGLDSINFPLQVTAYNASGGIVEVAPEAIYFLSNSTILTDSKFSIKSEGVYTIIAKLGEAQSDTLLIRILDPSKLSLHLAIDSTQQIAFSADGKSRLDFDIKLLHNGAPVALSSQFILYCNNEEIKNNVPFTTRKAAEYKFIAKGANLESNQITLEALSPVKKLTLSKDKNDEQFFGFNLSEVGFVLSGLDANNQPVELSEDIRLFSGSKEIDKSAKFKTSDLGRVTFQAKGYKIESNQLDIDVKSPVKTLKLSYAKAGNTFWADDVSQITFSLQALDFNDKQITPTADVKLYMGTTVVDYNKPFTTLQSGELKFRAKGFNSESEEIKVTAVATTNYNIVRIPVIFHEVNTTALTQDKINALLDDVTKAYRNKFNASSGPKDPNSSDFFLEFYAVERDLNGNALAVKGLDRVSSTKNTFNTTDQSNELVEDSWRYFWNPDQYLNVWIYSNITGTMANASFAYYPTVAQPLAGTGTGVKGSQPYYTYGVYFNANHLNSQTVLSHEIGHMMALYHVFDGNLYTHNGCGGGDPDFCNDTPFYNRGVYETNVNTDFENRFNRESCQGIRYVSTNFMDYYYSYDNSFTFDQRLRARHVISYGLYLPTPYNGFANGRKSSVNGLMKKPANYKFIKPVSCNFPH